MLWVSRPGVADVQVASAGVCADSVAAASASNGSVKRSSSCGRGSHVPSPRARSVARKTRCASTYGRAAVFSFAYTSGPLPDSSTRDASSSGRRPLALHSSTNAAQSARRAIDGTAPFAAMHSGDEEAAPSDASGVLYATREPRLRAKFEKIFVYCI